MKLWPQRLRPPRIRLPTSAQLEPLVRVAFLLAGIGALCRGLWLIYEPAAWIAGGLIGIWAAVPARGERR